MKEEHLYKDQKAVCHRLAAVLNLADDTKTRPHKPMLAEWSSEILNVSVVNVY